MENERKIFDNFLKLDFDTKLELLKWLDDMTCYDFTKNECVFYEFEELDLHYYFKGNTLSEIINIVVTSNIKPGDDYFYKDIEDNNLIKRLIISCDKDYIDEKIQENKKLITSSIKTHLKEIEIDFGIDFTKLNDLEVGDYISFPNYYSYNKDDEESCLFTQIVKVDGNYSLINVDTFESEIKIFGSLNEINNFIESPDIDAIPYYVIHERYECLDNMGKIQSPCNFLVYDKNCGGEYKISILFEEDTFSYKIMNYDQDDYFYPDEFDTMSEAFVRLNDDYYIVKKLRD